MTSSLDVPPHMTHMPAPMIVIESSAMLAPERPMAKTSRSSK
jgi:hypothetical protein